MSDNGKPGRMIVGQESGHVLENRSGAARAA